jgi:acyl-CoA thioester hydrolase
MVAAGSDVVVVDARATFHASPKFDDLLDVEMTIAKLGNSSMTSAFEEKRDGHVLVSGRMVHVFVDPETMQKQPIPDHMRTTLTRYVA